MDRGTRAFQVRDMTKPRKSYPSDVCDGERALVVPYLSVLPESAKQRTHPLREAFNGLRYVARNGIPWRAMPNGSPPWHTVHDQAQRWLRLDCFEQVAHDLRAVLRLAVGCKEEPKAAVLDGRTLRGTPESGGRAAWDGHKRAQGSKPPRAVDTPGHLLALHVTPAGTDERVAVGRLVEAVQEATNENVRLAHVDQGYTGEQPAEAAQAQGIALEAGKLPEAKRGFVLLPRRWGSSALLCLEGALPPAGARRRAFARNPGRLAPRCLRHPAAAARRQLRWSMTASEFARFAPAVRSLVPTFANRCLDGHRRLTQAVPTDEKEKEEGPAPADAKRTPVLNFRLNLSLTAPVVQCARIEREQPCGASRPLSATSKG